jgi:hypothetical protein
VGTLQQFMLVRKGDCLLAASAADGLQMVLDRLAGKTAPTLGGQERFQATLAAAVRDLPTAQLRWYAEPLACTEAMRTLTGEKPQAKQDLLPILKKEGFEALQGIGGVIVLAGEDHEALTRTYVHAPGPFQRAMRMLDFANSEPTDPPAWVPEQVASYVAVSVNYRQAFDAYAPLFDALYGEGEKGVFEDILKGLRDDPDGPSVNLRKDVIGVLGRPASLITLRPGPRKRLQGLTAASVPREKPFADALRRLFDGDEDVESLRLGEYGAWRIKSAKETKSAKGAKREKGRRQSLPPSTLTVAHQSFLMSERPKLLGGLTGSPKPLSQAPAYREMMTHQRTGTRCPHHRPGHGSRGPGLRRSGLDVRAGGASLRHCLADRPIRDARANAALAEAVVRRRLGGRQRHYRSRRRLRCVRPADPRHGSGRRVCSRRRKELRHQCPVGETPAGLCSHAARLRGAGDLRLPRAAGRGGSASGTGAGKSWPDDRPGVPDRAGALLPAGRAAPWRRGPGRGHIRVRDDVGVSLLVFIAAPFLQGAAIFQYAMTWERVGLFAAYLGMLDRQLEQCQAFAARRQLEQCQAFAARRQQFQRPIGEFQAVVHSLVDMKPCLESARLLIYRAAWALDQGGSAILESALAKVAVSEAAIQSSLDAVQLHGALGLDPATGVEGQLRDALPATIFSGTSEVLRNVIAAELGL